jgi:pimeloyl-ACP methyl ester carboxylesterase
MVGTSLGGAVAIDFALAHPEAVEKLVLFAPQVPAQPHLACKSSV